ARLVLRGMWSASSLSSRLFADESARALLVGSAVHAIRPPSQPGTAAFGLLFNALGMTTGWPVISGGTGQLPRALARVIEHYGGTIETGAEIRDLSGFATYDAVVTTQTPRQLLALQGLELSRLRSRSLSRWKYGTAVYKVDYLMNGPVKWNDPRVAEAGTVHVGGTVSEMQLAESQAAAGRLPERPFVMVCQQQAADPTRLSGSRRSVEPGRVASAQPDSGKVSEGSTQPHILWSYAHVPYGYQEKFPGEVAGLIEAQISRFASGFSAQIIERNQVSPAQLQEANANLIGGDIAGGAMNLVQMSRQRQYVGTLTVNPEVPVLQASGASLPGAGVHGMAGWRAAHRVLRRLAD
ncbi:phytoene desaturase family protein, partial [Corynebacterium propinquum]